MSRKKCSERALVKQITITLNTEDLSRLKASCKNSTTRHLSTYLRFLLLREPITFYTRNKSLDELMVILRQLKSDLQQVENDQNALLLPNTAAGIISPGQLPAVNGNHQTATLHLIQNVYDLMQQITNIWLQD